MGNASIVRGTNTIVLGSNIDSAGNNSVVLGNGSDGSLDNVVSVGGTAAGTQRKIVNVAAGTTTTDAVNFGQLTAMGAKIDTSGHSTNAFVAYDNNTSMDTITLQGTAGSTKITKLTAGTLSATSTDAVNGSQLFNTASSAAAAIGGGSTLNPATGTISKPSISVGGVTYTDVSAAVTAAGTAATTAQTGLLNAVQYDTTAHSKVTFGGTGSAVTLSNVAKGMALTDAVNVAQLNAMGGKVDSSGNPTNAFVAYDNNTSKDTITLQGTAGSTKITKLTAGSLSATSTDAVNGTQLFNAASSAAAAIGGGSTLNPATGTISKPSISVGGTTYTDVSAAITAAGTAATTAQTGLVDAVKYDTALHNKVTLGTVGSLVTLTNVAAGTTTNDAVNLGQLNSAIASVSGGLSPNAVSYDTSAHDKVTFGGTGPAVTLSNVAKGVALTDAVNVAQLNAMGGTVDSSGNPTNAFVAYDNNTSKDTITLKGTAGTTKITKLTNGTLSATSSDAVNGSQLFNTASSAAAAIGGGSTLNAATGTISKPSISVGGTTYTDVSAAITAAGTAATTAQTGLLDAVKYDTSAHNKVTLGGTGSAVTLSNVATGVANTDAVNVAQLAASISTVTDSTKQLNNALKYVSFGPSAAGFANAGGTDAIALGGNSFASSDRALAIGLNARAGFADSVAIGSYSIVSAANTVSVGSIGSERRITNVAIGTRYAIHQRRLSGGARRWSVDDVGGARSGNVGRHLPRKQRVVFIDGICKW